MKKRRSKKHNRLSSLLKQVRLGFKDLAVYFSLKNQELGCELINHRLKQRVTPTRNMAESVTKLKHNWTITLIATARDENGRDYMKSATVSFDREMYQAELVDYLNIEHKSFVDSEINKNHLVDICWVACLRGTDFKESEIADILDFMGGWDSKALWEMEND